MSTYQERVALTDAARLRIKRAIAYLRGSDPTRYARLDGKSVVEWLPADYWTLLDAMLDLSREIVERMADDYFVSEEVTDFFGLNALILDEPGSRMRNFSDDWLEKAKAIVAEIERRQERGSVLRKIEALENVEGRTPEEAALYLAKADELRRTRAS